MFADFLRRGGVTRVAELPLELEVEMQEFLARAGAAIVPRLAEGLRDANPRNRARVATYLGKVGDPSAIPPLREALQDPDPTVRCFAGISLHECGAVEALEELARAIEDPDPRVRGAACDALRFLANQDLGANPFDPPARRAEAVRRWVEYARSHAGWTLEQHHAQGFREEGYAVEDPARLEAAPALIQALGAPQPWIVRNAERALGRLASCRRTLADELAEVDPRGDLPYEQARGRAVARLSAFYRKVLDLPE